MWCGRATVGMQSAMKGQLGPQHASWPSPRPPQTHHTPNFPDPPTHLHPHPPTHPHTQTCPPLQVDFVAHSAGGWLGRAFIGAQQYKGSTDSSDEEPHEAVRALITLGSPHTPPPPEKVWFVCVRTRGERWS